MKRKYQVRDRQGNLVDRDDDAVLGDGETLVVGLHMRDSMTDLQKAIAEDAIKRSRTTVYDPKGFIQEHRETEEHTDDAATVCDALGRSDPVSLGIPGSRYLRAGDNTTDHAKLVTADAMREEARAEAIRDAANAWRDARPDQPAGAYPLTEAKVGSPCTVNGQPGTLQREGDALVCRPTAKRDSAAAKAEAWEQLQRDTLSAWRTT